jgi:hypothetical protein
MTSKFLSLVAGVATLGLVGAANAAEPMQLSDLQMDTVTAASKGHSHHARGHARGKALVNVNRSDVIKQDVTQTADVYQANVFEAKVAVFVAAKGDIYFTQENTSYVTQTATATNY